MKPFFISLILLTFFNPLFSQVFDVGTAKKSDSDWTRYYFTELENQKKIKNQARKKNLNLFKERLERTNKCVINSVDELEKIQTKRDFIENKNAVKGDFIANWKGVVYYEITVTDRISLKKKYLKFVYLLRFTDSVENRITGLTHVHELYLLKDGSNWNEIKMSKDFLLNLMKNVNYYEECQKVYKFYSDLMDKQ